MSTDQNNTTLPEDLQTDIEKLANKYCRMTHRAIGADTWKAFTAGATAYAPWKVKHDLLQKENERLRKAMEDIQVMNHPADNVGRHDLIVRIFAKTTEALAGKGGEEV